MANIQLSVDLGSKFITICQKDVGLVLREPCVAIAQKTKDHYELREVGFRAESIISTSLGGAKVVCPVQEGFIVDEEMFTLLLKEFLKKILPSSFIKPRVKAIVSITCAMTNSDRRAVEKCFVSAGIKEIILVESPLSMLAYTGSIGGMFVDMGAGKTEIASVTNRGIASAVAVNIAGEAFNNAIIDSLQKHYGVKLGAYTVEKMKKNAYIINTSRGALVDAEALLAGIIGHQIQTGGGQVTVQHHLGVAVLKHKHQSEPWCHKFQGLLHQRKAEQSTAPRY